MSANSSVHSILEDIHFILYWFYLEVPSYYFLYLFIYCIPLLPLH